MKKNMFNVFAIISAVFMFTACGEVEDTNNTAIEGTVTTSVISVSERYIEESVSISLNSETEEEYVNRETTRTDAFAEVEETVPKTEEIFVIEETGTITDVETIETLVEEVTENTDVKSDLLSQKVVDISEDGLNTVLNQFGYDIYYLNDVLKNNIEDGFAVGDFRVSSEKQHTLDCISSMTIFSYDNDVFVFLSVLGDNSEASVLPNWYYLIDITNQKVILSSGFYAIDYAIYDEWVVAFIHNGRHDIGYTAYNLNSNETVNNGVWMEDVYDITGEAYSLYDDFIKDKNVLVDFLK